MFISKAYAQEVATEVTTAATDATAVAPSAGEAFAWNIGLIVILVVMFYFLLIRPQQKRFKEHKNMLDSLKKGDRVVTGGGLVGVVDTLPAEGSDEVVVDLGNGLKVTALRSSIQTKVEK